MSTFKLAVSFCFIILVSAVFTASAQAQPASAEVAYPLTVYPRDRITIPVEDRSLATLPNNVHSLARPEADVGPVPGSQVLHGVVLALRRDADQQAALDALSNDLQNPRSPRYHQWLTPQSFGDHFGVSQNDLEQVAAWLKSGGFTVDDIPPAHWTITFSGTVAQVEAAFHTSIHYYRVDNQLYYANTSDPQVPQGLAAVMYGFEGLSNFPAQPAHKAADPRLVFNGFHFLDPPDFATIYDLKPLYAAGITGKGVSIGVLEPCTMDMSLALNFWNFEGLPQQEWWYWDYSGTPATCTGSDPIGEVYLDYEWAGAVAPDAQVWLVSSDASDPLFGAASGVVNYPPTNNVTGSALVPVLSMSWQYCGDSQSADQTWMNLWQQASTQGVTAMVSAGDTGAAGCDIGKGETTATNGLAINDLCQSPYVVCVGGTQFNEGSDAGTYWTADGHAISYIPEVAWNEVPQSGDYPLKAATGGGYSAFVPKPSWQTQNTTAHRGTPDVSLAAADHDGYHVCNQTASTCNQNSLQWMWGTSAAAPSFAGIMALLVQQSGQGQGSANQTMYALAGRTDLGLVFHDIVSGNNSVPGQTGYNAAPGWDPVTGLGSVDANALITNWPNAFAPEVTMSSNSLVFSNTAVGAQSASQTVTLTSAAPPDPSGKIAPVVFGNLYFSGSNQGDFAGKSTCISATLAGGQSCTITVQMQPTATGTRAATVVINDNTPNSPQTLYLTGTSGGSGASLISFDSQTITAQAPPGPGQGCSLPPAGTSFPTTVGAVYLYFSATVTTADSLTSDWLAPDGTDVPGVNWNPISGTYCFIGASLAVGNLPASRIGAWQARVFDNGNLLFTLSFAITSASSAAVLPVITAVTNGASFQTDFASATWVTIWGSNFTSNAGTIWDFTGPGLPTSLNGITVTIDGQPAYVEFAGPTQINVLAPDDPATGSVQVQVSTPQGASNTFTAQKQSFSPAFFAITSDPAYVAARHADYSLIGKPGLLPGAVTTPATPGETILLYATGFGPTNPPLPTSQLVNTAAQLPNNPALTIGGVPATVVWGGLVESGLYQLNVTVPSTLPSGDAAVVAQIGGVQSASGVLLTVQ